MSLCSLNRKLTVLPCVIIVNHTRASLFYSKTPTRRQRLYITNKKARLFHRNPGILVAPVNRSAYRQLNQEKKSKRDAYTKVLNYTAPNCPGTYVVTISATATAGSRTSTPVSVTLTVNVQ